MGVMMKIPTCYAISIPNRFAFGLNVYRNDCTAACQDFLGREERMEYENIKKSENFFEKSKIVNFIGKGKQNFSEFLLRMIYDFHHLIRNF